MICVGIGNATLGKQAGRDLIIRSHRVRHADGKHSWMARRRRGGGGKRRSGSRRGTRGKACRGERRAGREGRRARRRVDSLRRRLPDCLQSAAEKAGHRGFPRDRLRGLVEVGRGRGRRGLGALLHRALAARALFLARATRGRVGDPAAAGRQPRAALAPPEGSRPGDHLGAGPGAGRSRRADLSLDAGAEANAAPRPGVRPGIVAQR